MTRLIASAGLGAALLLAGLTQAAAAPPEVSLIGGRVGAADVAAVAKFYQSAFGLKQTRRIEAPGMLEIMMNFGDTEDAAKANTSPVIVVMHRDSDDIKDTVPHLLFNVSDIAATAAAVKAAGGKMASDPRPLGNTGTMIGFAQDPAGNQIELIQRPKPAKS